MVYYVAQAGLELMEIHMSLPNARIKGEQHHALLPTPLVKVRFIVVRHMARVFTQSTAPVSETWSPVS